MMPAPTKGQPVEPTTSAISSMLRGLTALHSTYTGFLLAAVSTGARRLAKASASPGGTIESRKSLSVSCASATAIMPAALARAALAALRPASEVSTFTLFSVRRLPTALPMLPGAMMATVGVMDLVLHGLPGGLRPWTRLQGARRTGQGPPMHGQ